MRFPAQDGCTSQVLVVFNNTSASAYIMTVLRSDGFGGEQAAVNLRAENNF